jgi:hypothetical protein
MSILLERLVQYNKQLKVYIFKADVLVVQVLVYNFYVVIRKNFKF